MNHSLVLALLLAASPSPAPSPAATPHTIVTTKSSPYCTALGRHFNGAFTPMVANDRTLTIVGSALDDVNTLFSKSDYVSRFIKVRQELAKESDLMLGTMPRIQDEINALRQSASLTQDAKQAKEMLDAASELQAAYVKQHAMAIDIQNLARTMMDYDIIDAPHPLGGMTPDEASLPKEWRDIKTYLRFDGQRDEIARHEEKAVDTAYNAATTACIK